MIQNPSDLCLIKLLSTRAGTVGVFSLTSKVQKMRERVSIYQKNQNHTQDIQTGAFSHVKAQKNRLDTIEKIPHAFSNCHL